MPTFFENQNKWDAVVSADHYEKYFELLRLGADFEKIVSNVDMLFETFGRNIRFVYGNTGLWSRCQPQSR